jgi:hypothetical protein
MNRSRALLAWLSFAILFLTACVTPPPPPDYSLYMEEDPKSVLIVPVINNSPEVGADEYFLATVTVPVAERGYYVFPVNLTRELLADAGLSDAGLVHAADVRTIAGLFDADAILFIQINNWEAKYLLLSTTVVVSFDYILKSGRSGRTLWSTSQTMQYTPQSASSGNPLADLIVMAAQAAITKAMPNYMPLARQANWKAVAATHVGPGQSTVMSHPMLMGPFHPRYQQDWVEPTPKAQEDEAAAQEEEEPAAGDAAIIEEGAEPAAEDAAIDEGAEPVE